MVVREIVDKLNNKDLSRDLQVGRSVISAYLNSSHMNWDRGSALIFLCWPTSLRHIARDIFPSRLLHELPTKLKRTNDVNETNKDKLLENLCTCLLNEYLQFISEKSVKS